MLKQVRLQNFRSYKNKLFELSPLVNVVVGLNGSGKTNLLESVLVLARGGSYRGPDGDLLRFKSNWSRLEAEFNGQSREVKLEKSDAKVNKSFIIGQRIYKRLPTAKVIPAVLFEPNHLQLLSRGPETRRNYLDELIVQLEPGYQTLLNRYKRSLVQRNAQLKSSFKNPDQLFVWDLRLSEYGGQIASRRTDLINSINRDISNIYSTMALEPSKLKLVYTTRLDLYNYTSSLLNNLQTNLKRDMGLGYTTCGPHRDDVTFFLDNQDAALSASRGEVRSLLLALKVFELTEVTKRSAYAPILLLDDVFSELDRLRQQALVECFKRRQVIITTTDINALIRGVRGKIIEL